MVAVVVVEFVEAAAEIHAASDFEAGIEHPGEMGCERCSGCLYSVVGWCLCCCCYCYSMCESLGLEAAQRSLVDCSVVVVVAAAVAAVGAAGLCREAATDLFFEQRKII